MDDRIVTIPPAEIAMSIESMDDVKLGLLIDGDGDDALIAQLQSGADGYVETYCGRAFGGGTFTEYFAGGSRVLLLRQYPVLAVASVHVDAFGDFGSQNLRDPQTYIIHPERGAIESQNGAFLTAQYPRAVRVIYSTATGAVPADVSRAYIELIAHWYRQAKTQQQLGNLNVLSQTADGVITSYPWGQSGGFRIPNSVVQLLAPHRVPTM